MLVLEMSAGRQVIMKTNHRVTQSNSKAVDRLFDISVIEASNNFRRNSGLAWDDNA